MTTAALAAPQAALARPHPWLDRELYPFTPRRFATADGALSYLDDGPADAPVVLLVHGTPSWSFEWREVVRGLSKDHRVIAPDHLGFGLSDRVTDASKLTPEAHAKRLVALADALELRDVRLVLHDFGGPIGMLLALERPERVRSIAVMNTWAWAHAEDPKIGRMSRLVGSWLGRWLYLSLNASARWIVPMAFGDKKKLTPRIHGQYLAPFGTREERVAPWVMGVELAGSDPYYASLWARRALLSEKLCAIVWGMADPAFDRRYLARWRESFPKARLTEIEGAGHFPQEEAPERVVEALRAL